VGLRLRLVFGVWCLRRCGMCTVTSGGAGVSKQEPFLVFRADCHF
jgi:hypothetical protein